MQLIIFGDSFAQDEHRQWQWFKQLASDLKVNNLINYAKAGSSLEYSYNKLFNYLEYSNDYNESDIIIFLATSGVRSPIVHDEYEPAWASYVHHMAKSRMPKMEESERKLNEHYESHQQYYRTLVKYNNNNSNKSKHFVIASTLHNLPNKVLYLLCIDKLYDLKTFNTFFTRQNMIIPRINLINVSKNEIEDSEFFPYPWDYRMNHITKENHKILAFQAYNTITSGKDCFDLTAYKQKILNKKNLHKSFIREWVLQWSKKKNK